MQKGKVRYTDLMLWSALAIPFLVSVALTGHLSPDLMKAGAIVWMAVCCHLLARLPDRASGEFLPGRYPLAGEVPAADRTSRFPANPDAER